MEKVIQIMAEYMCITAKVFKGAARMEAFVSEDLAPFIIGLPINPPLPKVVVRVSGMV